jgi:hypothetical protein
MTVSPVSTPTTTTTTPAVVKKTKPLTISLLKKKLGISKSKAVATKKPTVIKNPNPLNSKHVTSLNSILASLKVSIAKLENVINQISTAKSQN